MLLGINTFDGLIDFWIFPFSDMKLLRMMSTMILYNVICDRLYFGDKYTFPDSRLPGFYDHLKRCRIYNHILCEILTICSNVKKHRKVP